MSRLRQSSCRTCEAPIVWLRTPAGKQMPTEPDSVDESELEFDERGRGLWDPDLGHESHFANCPGAEKHRRPRGSGGYQPTGRPRGKLKPPPRSP